MKRDPVLDVDFNSAREQFELYIENSMQPQRNAAAAPACRPASCDQIVLEIENFRIEVAKNRRKKGKLRNVVEAVSAVSVERQKELKSNDVTPNSTLVSLDVAKCDLKSVIFKLTRSKICIREKCGQSTVNQHLEN
jgi:hypothetical protein